MNRLTARLAAEARHGEAEVVAEVRHPLPAALVVEEHLHHLAALVLAACHAPDEVVCQEAALGVAACRMCERVLQTPAGVTVDPEAERARSCMQVYLVGRQAW